MATWIAGADAAAADSPTPWITRLLHLLDHVEDHPLLWRVIAEEPPELVNDALRVPSASALVANLASDLRAAQRGGLVRTDLDADVVASGLETLFLGLLLLRVRAGDRYRERLDGLGALFVGILTTPTPPTDTPSRRRTPSAR